MNNAFAGLSQPAKNDDTPYRHVWLIAWILFFSIAYILRDVFKLSVPEILFTGLCAVAFSFMNLESAMAVYLFISALTVPDFEIRIVYIVILLIKGVRKKQGLKVIALAAVGGLLLLEVMDLLVFSGMDGLEAIYACCMRLSVVVLPMFWVSGQYSAQAYKNGLLCYVAGAMLGGTVLLITSIEAVGFELLINSHLRLGMNTTEGSNLLGMHTSYNANQLAVMFVIAISILAVLAEEQMFPRGAAILLTMYSLFIILLTKSRTGVLLFLFLVVFYVGLLLFQKKRIVRGVGVFLLAVFAVFVVVSLFPNAVERILDRVAEDEDVTGGREELFVAYLQLWLDNIWVFLFGYGAGSYRDVVEMSAPAHSAITDVLICWGSVGMLLVVCLFVFMYRCNITKVKLQNRMIALLPALVAIGGALTGQLLTVIYPFSRLGFLVLAVKAFSENETQDIEGV